MNVIFRLDNSTNGYKLIKLVYRFSGEKFVYSTGEKIQPEYWDTESNRPILSNKFDKVINSQNKITKNVLDRYEAKIIEIVGEVKRASAKLTKDYLQTEMDKSLKFKEDIDKKAIRGKIIDFYNLIYLFIVDSESGKRLTKKGTVIGFRRIKKYNTIINTLKLFRDKINVNDIDLKFYSDFIAFRNTEKKIKKDGKIITIPGKSLNTVGMDIKVIKTILRETFKQGLHNNKIFESEDFRTFDEEVENVYLNDAELDVLWSLSELNEKLSLVRDVFLIGCYTGLRISDLSMLSKSNIIQNGKVLKVVTEKTKEIVYIPIHWRVLEIIKKYDGNFPVAYSDQKMNDYVKDLCLKAKFEEQSVYKKTVGGKVITYTQFKWERITNHTARRSFASNLYLAGFDTISIMKLTGHQSEKSFMKYICITQRQMVDKMLTHPYFIEPN